LQESFKEDYKVILTINGQKENAYGFYTDAQIDIINNEMKKPKEKRLYKLGIDWSNVDGVDIIQKESFKESSAHKYSKQEVIDYLVKGGSNIDNAKRLVDKNWDYIHRVYDGQNLSLKGVNDLIRNLGESYKEQVIPMVVDEASKMFYQGFEIGAVKSRLKDKYPSISVVDINDSVDRAFSDVGSKEESFKKLKEKFIKKEYMYNNKFFSNNLEVDWVDKASGTADLILHWPDGNGKIGFTINKNNNNIKDINIIKLPNDYQGVSHGQAMMDINQEIKYYIGPEVKRKLFESYNKKESLTLDDVAQRKYSKNFKDLTPEEKKYVNYVYAEWSDDSYDEACNKS